MGWVFSFFHLSKQLRVVWVFTHKVETLYTESYTLSMVWVFFFSRHSPRVLVWLKWHKFLTLLSILPSFESKNLLCTLDALSFLLLLTLLHFKLHMGLFVGFILMILKSCMTTGTMIYRAAISHWIAVSINRKLKFEP